MEKKKKKKKTRKWVENVFISQNCGFVQVKMPSLKH